ncbi:MAG: 2'-5' RNA ligase family protein [Micrococcales bacterium]|uniref:2'-5' RNA ligase family protein n=1 Tax=Phycicoccus sp. TaxID=1902410 RepID=UPI0019CE5E00|nr:2'-5' RNA ligase family protein [Phycicoccus sp.]MBD3784566.1 2'-5' RNA ligase family protein [Micrococcales bacterium]HMM93633.1 2'-5' RNA ligase family protein [Phycicoccus sp.]
MPMHGVAVTVPEPWGEQLQSARAEFGDPMAGAIPPHVTLLPPTAVTPELLEDFNAHLDALCREVAPFRMVLSGTGTFRPVSPVVFVQVSSGIAPCEQLERAIRSGPVRRELEFPYHPHVTIAHHLDDESLDRAFAGLADFRCAFEVRSLELYHHDPDGVWRVVRSVPLGG